MSSHDANYAQTIAPLKDAQILFDRKESEFILLHIFLIPQGDTSVVVLIVLCLRLGV